MAHVRLGSILQTKQFPFQKGIEPTETYVKVNICASGFCFNLAGYQSCDFLRFYGLMGVLQQY